MKNIFLLIRTGIRRYFYCFSKMYRKKMLLLEKFWKCLLYIAKCSNHFRTWNVLDSKKCHEHSYTQTRWFNALDSALMTRSDKTMQSYCYHQLLLTKTFHWPSFESRFLLFHVSHMNIRKMPYNFSDTTDTTASSSFGFQRGNLLFEATAPSRATPRRWHTLPGPEPDKSKTSGKRCRSTCSIVLAADGRPWRPSPNSGYVIRQFATVAEEREIDFFDETPLLKIVADSRDVASQTTDIEEKEVSPLLGAKRKFSSQKSSKSVKKIVPLSDSVIRVIYSESKFWGYRD